MSPGATFERVYLALKARIMSGTLPAGEPLEPRLLGEDLISSITPIRDALHRLVGERLVDAPRNHGFRVPVLSEAMVRDLYGWRTRLLLAALAHAPAAQAPEISAGDRHNAASESRPAAALFLAIAGVSGSRELRLAMSSANDRLHALHQAEIDVLGGEDDELAELEQMLASGDRPGLRRLLVHYHRRREKHVSDIIARRQGPA
jgi:DNA-binding GntR family transcriptional regulator